MHAPNKTFFLLKPTPKDANGVATPSYQGIAAGLRARQVSDDQIVSDTSLQALVEKASANPASAVLVVPGGNALVMLEHIGGSAQAKRLAQRMRTMLAGGTCYVGICAGAVLASRELAVGSLKRAMIPEWNRADFERSQSRGNREQVREAVLDMAAGGDIGHEEIDAIMPKATEIAMLGLAAGITSEAYAYFGAHAGRAAGTFPTGVDAPMRLGDNAVVTVPNIAGPRFTADKHAQVLATYDEFAAKPGGIVRVAVGEGSVTLSAVHPELSGEGDAAKQAGHDRVFDEVFAFTKPET